MRTQQLEARIGVASVAVCWLWHRTRCGPISTGQVKFVFEEAQARVLATSICKGSPRLLLLQL